MVDDKIDDADNEITRIVRRPGPSRLPINVGRAGGPAEVVGVGPTPAAPRVDASIVAAASDRISSVTPPANAPGAPVVSIDRQRPVLTPPAARERITPAARSEPDVVVPVPGASTPKDRIQPTPPSTPVPSIAQEIEPVVGWLVVVKGPGRGAAREIVTGRNAIGSAATQAIRLNFGDPAISAEGHAYIVYDDEAREFVVEDGKQKIVVRLNGKLLTETMPIGDGDTLRIGATTLRFVALCGLDFDWGDAEKAEAEAVVPETSADAVAAVDPLKAG